jgi:hypothetical protein
MSPKNKAEELVWKYLPILIIKENPFDLSKQCALIAVDEIINSNPHSNPFNTAVYPTMEYWQEVKNEIEKL